MNNHQISTIKIEEKTINNHRRYLHRRYGRCNLLSHQDTNTGKYAANLNAMTERQR